MNQDEIIEFNYKEKEGILFPDVKGELEEQYTQPLGKYGMLAKKFWEEHKGEELDQLIIDGIMMKTMHQIEDMANQRMEELQKEMLQKDPIKNPKNTMETYQHRQRIHDQAEEIVLNEIVYR